MQKQQLLLAESIAPAYPFSGHELYSDLRKRLAAHVRFPLSIERLARMIGVSRSTTHHWFEIYDHPHVTSFMCLLERLPEVERQEFIGSHCRALPALTHPALAHSPTAVGKLQELLREPQALTFICGADERGRDFVVSALGRWIEDRAATNVCGIDLHKPCHLVPLSSVRYVDPARLSFKQMQRVVGSLLPKLLTASRKLVIYNGVWSAAPDLRPMMLRTSRSNHVIVCDSGLPELRQLRQAVTPRITILHVEQSKQKKGAIRVLVRTVRRPRKKAAA